MQLTKGVVTNDAKDRTPRSRPHHVLGTGVVVVRGLCFVLEADPLVIHFKIVGAERVGLPPKDLSGKFISVEVARMFRIVSFLKARIRSPPKFHSTLMQRSNALDLEGGDVLHPDTIFLLFSPC